MPAPKSKSKPKSVTEKPKSQVKKQIQKSESERPLTPQQEAFCQQVVLNGGDKSAAYRKAYPKSLKNKDESINSMASRLFANIKVASRVKELQTKAAELAERKFSVDAEYILRRLHEVDVMDVADILYEDGAIKPIIEWPPAWRQNISAIEVTELNAGRDDQKTLVGVLKKIKWPDKTRNRELLGKHVMVNAFRDQVGISDPQGKPLAIIAAEMPAEEAAALYKELIGR
jgi:phage terminase small subunit